MTSNIDILILEDHHDTADLYQEILSIEGYKVAAEATFQKGLERLEKEPPRLVILDLDLPDQSGVKFLEILRKQSPALPVIVVTGSDRATWRVMCEEMGIVAYFVKPVIDHLIDTVNLHLQSRKPEGKEDLL
ncbi:MAG: response regulator [Blastocatellia bacterium]|nr:response regulator [Blastocatellia bacterium]